MAVAPSTVGPPRASKPPLAVSWPEMLTGWCVTSAGEPEAASSTRAGPVEVRLMAVAPSWVLPVTARDARAAVPLAFRLASELPPLTVREARAAVPLAFRLASELPPVTCGAMQVGAEGKLKAHATACCHVHLS